MDPSGHTVTDWDKHNLSKTDQARLEKISTSWSSGTTDQQIGNLSLSLNNVKSKQLIDLEEK